jgi:uncharacterized protein
VTEQDIIDLIKKDPWMMEILKTASSLNLPDWWIGAGFVRSKVWDYQHGYRKRTPIPDIDLIYFDKNDFLEKEAGSFSTKNEDKYQEILAKFDPKIKWSVTNQARMHIFHKQKPYKNSEEALSQWSETATCIGVHLEKDKLKMIAPYGTDDLINLILRRIPNYEKLFAFDPGAFERRIKEKKWLEKWPRLKVV